MLTIGVSIAVPDPAGRELQDYRIALGNDEARGIPTHITLLPPTEMTAEQVTALQERLSVVAEQTAAFEVHLRGTGTFRPISPVVFVGVVAGISECEQLAVQVRAGQDLAAARFPYHPHVTIAHELDEPTLDRAFSELADFELRFVVSEVHLYLNEEADGWRPVQTFSLRAE